MIGVKYFFVWGQLEFPFLSEHSRSRAVEMWEMRQRFPRTVESGVCFPQSVLSTAVWDRLRVFFGLLGLLDWVARDVELENHAVMNKPVDRGRRGHRVLEDPFPLGKGQVAGDEHATGRPHPIRCQEEFSELVEELASMVPC